MAGATRIRELVAFSDLEGLIVTEVSVKGNSVRIDFGDKRLSLKGCPYNDARCESCSCDKSSFKVSLTDCRST